MKRQEKRFLKRLNSLKKLISLLVLIMLLCAGCTSTDKPAILFNRHPISEQNVYDYSVIFPVGARIYYLVLVPKKIQSRYIYIQVIKKDNSYGRLGYNLIWTKDVRLKDEEVNYLTDYLVLNEKGFYIMKVYSKDNPQKVLTSAEFRVGE